ncbi:hypothetical protein Voc01_009190 [Virgisporangium ochraceum]|uniref:Tox-PL domain-containing protein n=2 Tax=Virgisporangium ochraceum TaxID=65505 RepID=A0A8J3ZKZ7_9ACTN|nr:hypothetical protein Voc01_009190 [Virgisporangium ochraceum]
MSAARGLGDALRGPRPAGARGYGTAAALALSDGVITTETSLREPLGRHPLATAMLSEGTSALIRRGQRAGIGQCVELTLVSDRLYQVEQRWTGEGRPGDLRSYALQAFRGATLTIRQIGDANGRPHGAVRPACRLCQTVLPALGVTVVEAGGWDPVPRPAPVVVPTPGDMRSTDIRQREWLLGAPFYAEGTGAAGLSRVSQRLLAAGSGATALVLVTWSAPNRGPYLLTAANRGGGVFWLDNPSREVSGDQPPYLDRVDEVWSVVLDAGGRAESEAASVPPPALADGPFDPARPTVHNGARLGELRLLVAAYPAADDAGRVALRAEIAALIDDLGVRPGTAESNGRWTTLPPDLAAALLALATPVLTPKAVATVLAADPARLNAPQRAWQRDFEDRLADAFTGTLSGPSRKAGGSAAVAAELADRLHRLAVAGEAAPASVPRLPAYAGQVIGLPPDRISVLRELDAPLADTATATGVYIDLTGRPDLAPYARTGIEPVRLPPCDADDLTTDHGRAALRDADRRQARADFRAAHSGDPATLTLLSTHDFHYVGVYRPGEPRELGLVPDLVAAAVRAISPVRPPPLVPPQRPPRPVAPPPATEEPAPVPAPAAEQEPEARPDPAIEQTTLDAEQEPEPVVPAAGFGVAALLSAPGTAPAPAAAPGPAPVAAAPVAAADPVAAVARAAVSVPVQRAPLADQPSFAYYALADQADRPTGLLVVAMLPTGPRTRRFEAAGARSAGSPSPVSRERAEEISRQALGFELPAEARLPEVFHG